MRTKNSLIISAAGSGKTRHLVEMALASPRECILITTYTEANEAIIRGFFIEKCGCVPPHVTIQTWFSFLIQHGVKPFQGGLLDRDTTGLVLVNQASTRGVPASNVERYYLTRDYKIYSDKLAKLVVQCNQSSHGMVMDRLSRIFTHIYVDEVQDLAGYDLDVLRLLFKTPSKIVLVGDPRQVTYLTHHETRYGKYQNGGIKDFILNECVGLDVDIDEELLRGSRRSNEMICRIADQLYPDFKTTVSLQTDRSGHDGVFVVNRADTPAYLERFVPVQLRHSSSVRVSGEHQVLTFGASKGVTFDRVLIYPTKDMVNWIRDRSAALAEATRAKFYVALTRARYSVAISCDLHGKPHEGVEEWPLEEHKARQTILR